ncbi:MAG TPA: exonuclease SbcCD subunit D [Longimicrobiales bacterium]
MLIAHLSDLHLGYRAYHRLAAGGINIRERDVAQAFRAAIDRLIELQPQLVVIAGDVFHSARPSNAAIADAFRQFSRLSAALSGTYVVIIAGDHDSPRLVETGNILRLFAEIPRCIVMDQDARAVVIPELSASVLGVPHPALVENYDYAPDADADVNVLVLHGSYSEEKLLELHDYGGHYFDVADLHPERWDYVALGHYHKFTELAPNMYYAGAIERVSNNIWGEAEPGHQKGLLTFDTDARAATFHPLETRPVIDLPRIFDANQRSAQELNEQIRKLVEGIKGGIEGKIVRLVIQDIPRDHFRELDHRFLRECKAQALHFHLDARRPQARITLGGARRYQTLEQELENFVLHTWHPSTREVDRQKVLELAQGYLQQAGAADAAEISALTADGEDG